MKRVLITGGSGLIGGRVAKYLAASGFSVRLGTRHCGPAFVAPAGTEVVSIDWADEARLCEISRGVDVIINAMGMNASACFADPVNALTVNGVQTARLVRAAVNVGVPRFIHLSTAHVYGSPLQGSICEATYPANLHPYATSHLAGEHAVLWADQARAIEGVVLRLSNAFGRPTHPEANCWTLLVNDLCRQAVERKTLTLRGSGLEYRDFIPLSSVCELIGKLCAIDDLASAKLQPNEPALFNVGSGCSTSTASMAGLIQARCLSVLGYAVGLQRSGQDRSDVSPLRYLSARLDQSMLQGRDRMNDEIDGLLRFCRDHFSS